MTQTRRTSSDYTCKLCRDRWHVAARYPAAKIVKRRTKGHAAFTTVANTCMEHAGRMRANDACSSELLVSTREPCYFCIKITPAEPLGRTIFFPCSDEWAIITLIVLEKRVKLDQEIAHIFRNNIIKWNISYVFQVFWNICNFSSFIYLFL